MERTTEREKEKFRMVSIGDQTEWVEKGLEKLRYDYDLSPNDYCIDVGSYRREWADEMIKKFGCHVECFDALDNRAAWTKDGVLSMGGAFYYTSMYDQKGVQEFRCFDIAPFLNREVAVIKINIEGGEYELLEYITEQGLHKNIKNIQVQFHKVDGFDYKFLYKHISGRLSVTHDLTYRYEYVWENWKRKL
jgi:hypothetical protein